MSLEAPNTLTAGAWQPDGRGVLRWVPEPHAPRGPGGRPRKGYTMPASLARAMHQRYNAGERGEDVKQGHRE
jgi:hypothetical protein